MHAHEYRLLGASCFFSKIHTSIELEQGDHNSGENNGSSEGFSHLRFGGLIFRRAFFLVGGGGADGILQY